VKASHIWLEAFTSSTMHTQKGYSTKTPHNQAQENISTLEYEQAVDFFLNKNITAQPSPLA